VTRVKGALGGSASTGGRLPQVLRVVLVGPLGLSVACLGPSMEVLEEDRSWVVTSEQHREDEVAAGNTLELQVVAGYSVLSADPAEHAVVLGRNRVAWWSNTTRALRIVDTEREAVLRYRIPADVVGVREVLGGEMRVITRSGEIRAVDGPWRRRGHARVEGALLGALGHPSGAGWLAIHEGPDEETVSLLSIEDGEVSVIAGPLEASERETIDGLTMPRWVIDPVAEGAIVSHATIPHGVWLVAMDGSVHRLLEGSLPSGGSSETVLQRAIVAVGSHFLRFMLALPSNQGFLGLYDWEGRLLRETRIQWPIGLIGHEPEDDVLYALVDLGEEYQLLVYRVVATGPSLSRIDGTVDAGLPVGG
jgi:hypothetical protein